MQEIQKLHHEAMNLAEEGFYLTKSKNIIEAFDKNKQAFDLEERAVIMLEDFAAKGETVQPTLAVLSSSAAWLAKSVNLNDKAAMYAQKVIDYQIDTQLIKEAKELLLSVS